MRWFYIGLLLGLTGLPTQAQAGHTPARGPWTPLASHGGVELAFIFYAEADGHDGGVVVRVTNTNAHAVTYRFTIIFKADGDRREAQAQGHLAPGQAKTGELDGLFWIPFEDGRAIAEVGLRGLRVVPAPPG